MTGLVAAGDGGLDNAAIIRAIAGSRSLKETSRASFAVIPSIESVITVARMPAKPSAASASQARRHCSSDRFCEQKSAPK